MKKTVKRIGAILLVLSLCMQMALGLSYEYDKNGRLKTVTYNDGTNVKYQYDSSGNIIQINQSAGNIIIVTFNADGGSCGIASK